MIKYINPKTGATLREFENYLVDDGTGEKVAQIRDGIPRFVCDADDYAESFGFQWNTWHSILSNSRSRFQHAEVLKKRSGLWDGAYEVEGKTLLECGMGGGDDTEVLLDLPFAELHAFDLSIAVDRAAKYLSDPRLRLSQASIFDIPYPQKSFDVVWCHRVLQHTPDPEMAMRSVCKMVKPGGFLFVHSYKRSKKYMQEFRYKYRWLTKRLPKSWVYNYVNRFGGPMHRLHAIMFKSWRLRQFAYRFVPFYMAPISGAMQDMSLREIVELEKMVTFDALTPEYDSPMSTIQFTSILEEEGFEITWLHDPEISPLVARAIKVRQE